MKFHKFLFFSSLFFFFLFIELHIHGLFVSLFSYMQDVAFHIMILKSNSDEFFYGAILI